MAKFWLKIIASDHVFYNGKCQMLVVPGLYGEKGIMAHHEAMIMATREGTVRFRPEEAQEWTKAVVGQGIVQVVNNRVTIIVDTAERPEDIDEARAKRALERAQEQMRQKQSIQEYKMSQASMARALTRLKERQWKDTRS